MILQIEGEITTRSATEFISSMIAEDLEIHIDSIGGDLFAGLKIYNAIKNHPQKTTIVIDGVAGSVASVIALSGSEKALISPTGSVMIHNALTPKISGNHNDLRKVADSLETYSQIVAKVYSENTSLSLEEALEFMNKEKAFNSEEAIKFGFSHSILEPLKAVAKINNIDMNLLKTIQNALNTFPENVDPITPDPENVDPTEPQNAALSPEQITEIEALIGAMIAEALAGTPSTEEVGNTIATVLNSIVSDGKVITNASPNNVDPIEPKADGITAFQKKMNELKSKNN